MDLADAVDKPIRLDFQNGGHRKKAVQSRPRRTPPQDVVHKRAIDPCHRGNMGRAKAELNGAGM